MQVFHDNLAYRTAERHVSNYAGESDKLEIMDRHDEAMECRECEDYLQLGIDAFDWICRADGALRRAASEGNAEYSEQVDKAFLFLFELWLRPYGDALKRGVVQQSRGFEVANFDEFQNCGKEAAAIVRFLRGEQPVNAAILELGERALEEHRSGQTAEFI